MGVQLSGRAKAGVAAAAVVALGAVAVGGTSLTGALFTDSASVGGQSVSTATVEITAGLNAGSSAINVSDLLPGDSKSTTITVTNTGSADAFWSVALPKSTGDAALESAVNVTVNVGSVTETHSLTAWQGKKLALATALEANAVQDVVITVSLPASAANALQGLDAGFSIDVASVQERNNSAWVSGFVS